METLTVGELKELLQEYDEDTLVVVSCDYGDRSNTQQAIALGEAVLMDLTETGYSDSGYKITQHGGGDEEVLLLNYDCWTDY